MSENKMLIDAAHPEETRVVVLRGGRVEEFDYESAARKQLRGNIYLAKVTRVEPALQAAFVDYGGNRHGFLAFNEIHPDYYQIPVADRLALLEEEARASKSRDDDADEFVDDASVEEVTNADDTVDEEGVGEAELDTDNGRVEVLADDDADLTPEADELESDESSPAENEPVGEIDDGALESASDDLPPLEEAPQSADEVDGVEDIEGDQDQSADGSDGGDDGADGPKVISQSMPRDPSVTEEPSDQQDSDQAGTEPDIQPDSHNDVEPTAKDTAEPEPQTASETETAPNEQPVIDAEPADADEAAEPTEQSDTIEAADDAEPREAEETAKADDEETGEEAPRSRRSNGRNSNGRRRRGRSRRSRSRDADVSADEDGDSNDQIGKDDALQEVPSRPRRSRRSYKIQEVVKRRQVLLIQVVKEERGNKGAALTTYLSLAGRYTVLMPNTARGGGISRKITNPQDRKRLKAIANELDVPEGMGLIIRTAGAARTKQEIRRDFEYLLRLWESVRELTLESTAPALVYEEGDLIKRSIRDLYNKDVDQVVVAGDEAYRSAKGFMRMLMPSHAKNVTCYSEPEPLFTRHGIERQLNAMFSPYVHLPSGGYLVINQTEALVAVDVNSGRSTREFSIEETALNTNLEAADEVARQLKLRDLAGLIVIDFIDMEERRNNRNVEKRIRDALHADRARIQVGRISPFGLLEMSRQRLRTGVLEGSTTQCEHCQGTGIIRSVESVALGVLRGLEDTVMAGGRNSLSATTTAEVALYILNNKRDFVIDMEKRLGMPISVEASSKMAGANFTIEKGAAAPAPVATNGRTDAVSVDWGFDGDKDDESAATAKPRDKAASDSADADGEGDERGKPRRRRRRRGGRKSGERSAAENGENEDNTDLEANAGEDSADNDNDTGREAVSSDDGEDDGGEERSTRRRRRGRRGGRRNRVRNRDDETSIEKIDAEGNDAEKIADGATADLPSQSDAAQSDDTAASQTTASDQQSDTPAKPRTRRSRRNDKPAPAEETPADAATTAHADSGTSPEFMDKELASQVAIDEQTDATASALSILTDPEAAIDATAPAPETANGDAAADSTEEKSPPRRSRGVPVSSEPRIERITVSPDAPASEDNATTDDDEAPAAGPPAEEKPARRGWWQRKLLGE